MAMTKALSRRGTRTVRYDATAIDDHPAFDGTVFAHAEVDIVISPAGVLIPQAALDEDPRRAGRLVQTTSLDTSPH